MKEEMKYILYMKNGKTLSVNQDTVNSMSDALDSGTKFISFKNNDDEVICIINVSEISHLTNMI